jgi:small-conductance mechanosensitive channel
MSTGTRHLDIANVDSWTGVTLVWTQYLPTIVPIAVALVFALGGYYVSHQAARWLRHRQSPPSSIRWARFSVATVGLLLAGATLFVAFGPLTIAGGLTLSAIVALVVSLAISTVIGNVLSGLILIRDRVLRLGDHIKVGGVEGSVVQLGLVTVWLRLDDGSLATISNSNLLSGPMVNRSAQDRLKGEY